MPVGKAQAATIESAGEEFRFLVLTFNAIDEAREEAVGERIIAASSPAPPTSTSRQSQTAKTT